MDYERETSALNMSRLHVHRAADGGGGEGAIAEAIAQEIGRRVDYAAVETDGASRAAALISDLL